MRLLLPVLLMLPMAQTIDDRQLYYDHDRDLDYKISKCRRCVPTTSESHEKLDQMNIDRN
jgi:hypothetical protein